MLSREDRQNSLSAINKVKEVVALDKSELVFFTKHAIGHMKKDGISKIQVLRVLKKRFSIFEEPFQEADGKWRLTIEGKDSGMLIRIALKIEEMANGNLLIVLTGFNPNARRKRGR